MSRHHLFTRFSLIAAASLVLAANLALGGTWTFQTFAGQNIGGPGQQDGVGPAARFLAPFRVAVGSDGTVYVADSENNTIRKITPAGVVTTLAGTAGPEGSAEGTGAAAGFNFPFGVAVGTWFRPSSARAAGQGGSFYTTQLTLANRAATDTAVTLQFLGHDTDGRGGTQQAFDLAAGKAVTYADALGSVFGLSSGYGAMKVSSPAASLNVLGQTSTPGPSGGTFGQSVPASGQADLVTTGAARSIVAVREDTSFLTNLILTNATEATLVVDVRLLSGAGAQLASRSYTLRPLGMTQVTQVVRDLGVGTNLQNGQLFLSTATPGGAFAAYASVIDRTTNDPRTLLPR